MGLELAGRDFPLSDRVPGGLGFKLAEAEASKNASKMMSLMLRLARKLVAEDHRDEFEDFIESDDFDNLDYDEISKAVAEAMGKVADRPTVKSESSSSGPGDTRASLTAVSSSQDTPLLPPADRYLFEGSAAS